MPGWLTWVLVGLGAWVTASVPFAFLVGTCSAAGVHLEAPSLCWPDRDRSAFERDRGH